MSTLPDDAYILELEDRLEGAAHAIEFLYGCLTDPEHYRMDYPHQTLEGLAKIRELLPDRPPLCIHSVRKPGECESCDYQIARAMRRVTLGLKAWG